MTSRTVTLWLPTPPSTNALFVVAGRRRVKSKKYTAWIDAVAALGSLADCGFVHGAVSISYEVAENGRRDIGNYEKPLTDLLVSAGVIESDRCACVRKITIEWSHDLDDGVQVTIVPAPPWVKRRGAGKK